jgi:DNA-binding CsgD family transcriptional regulator
VLGSADLQAGDPASAVRQLERAEVLLAGIGWHEIFHFRHHGDEVEALLRVGRTQDADALVDRLEASAARIPRPWITAVAARGRAMLLAARDDHEGAAAAFERALRAHEGGPGSFERGRTLLAQGRHLRRTKQKRLARASLEAALRVFGEQGATGWAEQALEELRRVASRTSPADLTATELVIARMAAAGLTNEKIAERAFVSRKTVEANLARAYRKLGIARRAQLAHALDAREAAAIS